MALIQLEDLTQGKMEAKTVGLQPLYFEQIGKESIVNIAEVKGVQIRTVCYSIQIGPSYAIFHPPKKLSINTYYDLMIINTEKNL